jgi:ABC-type transport system involved in multi-copper enzyme maturation permease subunit
MRAPNEIIHIFRKDVRHLRYDILIVCGLVALYTTWNVQQAHAWWLDRTVGHEFSPLIPLIVVAWAYLLARVIQSEALPGDRQFWLTRPYSRASLLASKILFAMLFVNLPMLISDIVTLRANGFPAASHIGALAWK